MAYADNGSVGAWTRQQAERLLAALPSVLKGLGFSCRVECKPQRVCSRVGITMDLGRSVMYVIPKQVWRLHSASLEACGNTSGSFLLLQMLVGHVVHAFRVAVAGLSFLSNAFDFAISGLQGVRTIALGLRDEVGALHFINITFEQLLSSARSTRRYVFHHNSATLDQPTVN